MVQATYHVVLFYPNIIYIALNILLKPLSNQKQILSPFSTLYRKLEKKNLSF